MNLKSRLTILSFLQFFIWGIWLISLGGYMFANFNNPIDPNLGSKVGNTYGTMGWASLFMPALIGIIADKYIRAEIMLGISHIIAGAGLYYASTVTNAGDMYWAIFFVSCFYMPTIGLSNSVSYSLLSKQNLDVQKTFAPIRVWGTVGFIVAEWAVDLLGWTQNNNQFYFAAVAGIITGLYCFTLPRIETSKSTEKKSFATRLGLDAFQLFKSPMMTKFFLFAMFLGAALQITNMFGNPFLGDFGKTTEYAESFAVKHSNILISLSQISETLFILAIPFFLKRFGIKQVMLISMIAWVLRFALFGLGNPGTGLSLLILSMIVYGMAFDFFNISGSLFVDREAKPGIRASAQGLFMLMTNGLGAILGGIFAGQVVDYFTDAAGVKDWPSIWYSFAAYSLVIAILFFVTFKYKHDPNSLKSLEH
ncbi:nucleoside permease [Lacibacter sediminis]|uniref:Nucleoside permease n=1 Tax=Lacibacter sediminis TaxID=2760713 RepID=A0A7G5XLT2_9BACT|nr:nucleoside permease [Lacibacter sediminis]QNA46435.1 nucleoside permease [Lacibacter sediminis]